MLWYHISSYWWHLTEKVFSEHGIDADIPNTGVPAAAGPVCPQPGPQPRAGLPGAGGRGPQGGQHRGVAQHGAAGRRGPGGRGWAQEAAGGRVQVARVGVITAANTDPAYQGQYWVDMFLR